MKPIATALFIATFLGTSVLVASSDDLPPSYVPSVHQVIVRQSRIYAVPEKTIEAIVSCESSGNPYAHKLTKREDSWGLVQINLLAHPEITKEEAINPDFAVSYLASELSTNHGGMWSCYGVK